MRDSPLRFPFFDNNHTACAPWRNSCPHGRKPRTSEREPGREPASSGLVSPLERHAYELSYNLVVIGLGSVSRVLPVPGPAEPAIGFKTVAEVIHLRNRVLERMDAAESLQAAEATPA